MIKTKQELMSVTNQWLSAAMHDLSNQILLVAEKTGMSKEEIASALTISPSNLDAVLNCDVNIPLKVFASILIASNKALEIKQLPFDTNVKIAQHSSRLVPQGRPIPQSRPMPQGRPMPSNVMPHTPNPRGVWPSRPSMDNSEGIDSSREERENTREPMRVMPRRDMVYTILDNGWETEIDLATSTDEELMSFINSKTCSRSRNGRVILKREPIDDGFDASMEDFENFMGEVHTINMGR